MTHRPPPRHLPPAFADDSSTTTTHNHHHPQPAPNHQQAAQRRAIAELIFFAGVNDLRRCRQIAATWNIDVTDEKCMDYDKRTPL